jgi:RNA polymerase sigma-70 factor (ECF subfamily)
MMKSDVRLEVEKGLPPLLPRLWSFGVVLSGDRSVAEDLVQQTCLRALERSDQYQPGTRLDRWTFAIMASTWKNQRRANAVRVGNGIVDAAEALGADLSASSEDMLFHKQVLRAVGELPEAQRTAMVLVYVEGFSYKEAANILEIPIGTVMSRLAAAKNALRHLRDGLTRHGDSLSGAAE